VPQNAATVVATTPGAVYTGVTMNTAGDMLYAANGTTGAIDEFDGSFTKQTTSGFVDPSLPAGFVPFNVEDIGGKVYVAYAPAGHIPQTKATGGMGAVAIFDESGDFLQQLVSPGSSGELASPWGMTIAPAGFGPFAIPVNTGANAPAGLWDLRFGSGGPTGDPTTLYFTDGINGEKDGLFAAIAVPQPSTWAMMLLGLVGLGYAGYRRAREPRAA
jgi:hypothetical protein